MGMRSLREHGDEEFTRAWGRGVYESMGTRSLREHGDGEVRNEDNTERRGRM